MSPPTITTSFMVISDTHGLDIRNNDKHPFHLPLPKIDVLLHCGDLTQVGGHGPFRQALNMMKNIDAELKLVIAGNHDLELDGEYWRTHLEESDDPEEHEQAVAIMKGPVAKEAGVTYVEEGKHTFTLRSGATLTIYASPYSPSFGDWAFGYMFTEDRFADIPNQIDILMTHGPPQGILDSCLTGNAGCKGLLRALKRTRPLMHCFGHIHEGFGAQIITWDSQGEFDGIENVTVDLERKRWGSKSMVENCRGAETLMVNAAIQGNKDEFCNPPWIVYLPLLVNSTTETL